MNESSSTQPTAPILSQTTKPKYSNRPVISLISSKENSVDMGFEVNYFADFGLIDLGNCFSFLIKL